MTRPSLSQRGAAVLFAGVLSLLSCQPHWPGARAATEARAADARLDDRLRIERQPVCVGSRRWSAGELGETVLYTYRREGRRLYVGYFVYWSTERPWGDNVYSYTLFPALVTDAVYSHLLYVLPGTKDLLYGPADVEGATVVFEEREDGSLDVVEGLADDEFHGAVRLSRSDLLDGGRVVLLTEAWSHQLGGHGGSRFARSGGALRCYEPSAVRPMTGEVAQSFRLGDEGRPLRARPAWHARNASYFARPGEERREVASRR